MSQRADTQPSRSRGRQSEHHRHHQATEQGRRCAGPSACGSRAMRQSDSARAAHACWTASRTMAGEADASGSASRSGSWSTSAICCPTPGRKRSSVTASDSSSSRDARHRRYARTARNPRIPTQDKRQQDEPDRQPEAKQPVEEHQDRGRRRQDDHRVGRKLEDELAVQSPAQAARAGLAASAARRAGHREWVIRSRTPPGGPRRLKRIGPLPDAM